MEDGGATADEAAVLHEAVELLAKDYVTPCVKRHLHI